MSCLSSADPAIRPGQFPVAGIPAALPGSSHAEAMRTLAGLLAGIPFTLDWRVPAGETVVSSPRGEEAAARALRRADAEPVTVRPAAAFGWWRASRLSGGFRRPRG